MVYCILSIEHIIYKLVFGILEQNRKEITIMVKNSSFQGVISHTKPGETLKQQYQRFATELIAGSIQD